MNILGMFFGVGGSECEEYSRNVLWVREVIGWREGGWEGRRRMLQECSWVLGWDNTMERKVLGMIFGLKKVGGED